MIKIWKFSLSILCVMSLLLCGCQVQPDPEHTTGTEATAPVIQGLPTPEHPGNALVPYDPAREIYFYGCEHVNSTIYLEDSLDNSLYFYVISKKPLNKDSIQVSLPITNSYTFMVSDWSEDSNLRETFYTGLEEGQEYGTVASDSWLPYYVYQNYVGVDFEQLGAKWQTYLDEVQKRSDAGEMSASETEMAALNEFVTMRDAALEGFKALKGDETREFYLYSILIQFSRDNENAVEEVVTELTVTIDGTQFTPFTGEIHLIPSARPVHYEKRISMMFSMMNTRGTGLYGDGIGRLFTHSFTAEEDITLMEYMVWEEQFAVLDLIVTISSNTGYSVDFYWDGSSPIDVGTGDRVSVTAIFHNPNMENFSYYQKMHSELVYAVGDQLYSAVTEMSCSSTITTNLHELYAIIFDGVDMEHYYRDYYYPTSEDWRAEYPK